MSSFNIKFNLKNSPLSLPLLGDYTSIIQSCGPRTAHPTTVHFSIKYPSGSHSLMNSVSTYESAVQCQTHRHGAGQGQTPHCCVRLFPHLATPTFFPHLGTPHPHPKPHTGHQLFAVLRADLLFQHQRLFCYSKYLFPLSSANDMFLLIL